MHTVSTVEHSNATAVCVLSTVTPSLSESITVSMSRFSSP